MVQQHMSNSAFIPSRQFTSNIPAMTSCEAIMTRCWSSLTLATCQLSYHLILESSGVKLNLLSGCNNSRSIWWVIHQSQEKKLKTDIDIV